MASARNLTSSTAVLEIEAPGRHQRAELAQAVAGHERWHGAAALAPQPVGRDAGGQHRRLSAFGRVQRLGGPFLAAPPQIVAEHLGGFAKVASMTARSFAKALIMPIDWEPWPGKTNASDMLATLVAVG